MTIRKVSWDLGRYHYCPMCARACVTRSYVHLNVCLRKRYNDMSKADWRRVHSPADRFRGLVVAALTISLSIH